jgi:hypothetical protein
MNPPPNQSAPPNAAMAPRFHSKRCGRRVGEPERSAEWQGAGVCGVPQPKHTTPKDGWQKMKGKK